MSILRDMIKDIESEKKTQNGGSILRGMIRDIEADKKARNNNNNNNLPGKTQEKVKTGFDDTADYEQRRQARNTRIGEIDTEINKIKRTNAHSQYTSANRAAAVAHRSAGVVTPKQIKTADEKRKAARAAYNKANAEMEILNAEKNNLLAEKKIDDIGEKYSIDVNDFSYSDLAEWAKEHNHTVDISFTGNSKMKAKKNATDEEKEAFKILRKLAEDRASREIAKEMPIMTSASSVAMAPSRGIQGAISTVEDSVNVAKGNEIDLFSPNKSLARQTRTVRETVDKEYASKWFGGAEAPFIGNVGSALYNAGMSIGDNVANMAFGAVIGNVASTAGLSAEATKNIVSGVTSSLMASDATVNSIIANKERGLSDGKALGLGIASGIIEIATEKYSIDKIIENPADTLKTVILKGMVAEGTEEMTSETLNKIMDGIVNQGNSELQIAIKNYIKDGHSKERAVELAWGDMLSDVLSAGITGAFSGMAMGGTFNAVNKAAGKFSDDTQSKVQSNAQSDTQTETKSNVQPNAKSAVQSNAQPSNKNTSNLGENGYKAFKANFKVGQDTELYTKGFRRMYNLGQSNIPLKKADAEIRGNKYIMALDPDQRLAAYYAGQNDAKAQLEAEKNAVKYVRYFSDDAGVVDNDVVKKVAKDEIRTIDKLARAVGAQVVFEEDIEGLNGYIEFGKIHISLNAENKNTVVAAHEVTHRMQELAPESYRSYRDMVMSTVGIEAVESYRNVLNAKDVYLSESEIIDEIVADYTGKILSDPKSMQKFVDDALNGRIDQAASIKENRNILQKLYDAITDFIKRVSEKFSGRKAEQNQAARETYGTDLETLKQAKNLLKKALRDSADVVSQLEKQGATEAKVETEGKIEYSYKGITHTGIRKYVSDFPANMPQEKRVELFKERISTVFNLGMVKLKTDVKKIEVKGDKFTYKKNIKGDKKAQSGEMKAKTNALYDLADILASSRFEGVEIEESYKDTSKKPKNKAHKGVKYWYKFKNTIIFDGIMYDVTFNIRDKGKEQYQYLIDFREIKKRTTQVSHTVKNNLRQAFELSSNERVSQKSDSVNTQSMQKSENNSQKKNSIKMDEDILKKHETLVKAYARMATEFEKLRKNNANVEIRKGKMATVAKKILNDFDLAYDAELLTEKIVGLSENTKQMLAGNMDIDTFYTSVREVAKDVIEAGTRSDSMAYTQSKGLRDYLRTTKITLSEEARNNLGDEYETIRKSTFGRLRLVKEGGTPIDMVYQELATLYPEYFSAETETNSSAQLKQIQSVLDGLQSLKSDVFDGYTDEAADWLSGLMVDRIYNDIFVSGETGKTTVSVDMKAMRTEMADNLQMIMNRERQWREREHAKLQAKFDKKTKNYTESRKKAIRVKQIKLHTERVSKALINPSERFAVPEDLKKSVAKFLSCINLENDRMGEKTREYLLDLSKTYTMIANQEYELGVVIDPQLIYNIDDICDAIEQLGVKEKRISDLDLVTLEKVYDSIMSIETTLRNHNKAFREGKNQKIDILAAKACDEIKQRAKGIKKNSKISPVKIFSDILNFDMVNPWDYFHQLGGTFEELFGDLRKGENKQIKNLARAKEYLEEMTKKHGISQKYIQDKSVTVFELANGERLELTKAQIMSFYLLWRQNQTHEHITEGGIRPATVTQKLVEKKGDEAKIKMTVSEDYSAVRPILDDVGKILGTLSDSEKKFAESISDFFTNECAEWGNEVSMQLYGYKKFKTPNYFPIVSDKMYLQEEYAVSADSTIKNMGVTKKRVKHANNPIIIEDIFDVYARHVSDMAKYNAYVLPLQDIQRVFNSRGLNGENNVKALVATKYGKKAVEYFSKLMVDINAGIKNQYGDAWSSKLISKYKQAKMGANVGVIIQQPMSYIRVAAMIDPKYMTEAMVKKVDIETVFKYSPIAQWKSWGFFSTDTGKDMYSLLTNKKTMSDVTMAPAGKADEMTWKRIWAAVELETADLHPDLQKGSEAFYEACGRRFDEVIDRTQVVDSTLHRSQALRSPNGITKMVYSFMSEPLKTYNLLRSATVDLISAKDANSTKTFLRTAGVCVVSSIALACVTGAFDALTDDDREKFVDSFKEHFIDNLKGDWLGMIPYVKDVYSVVQGFTVERMDMQGISDVVNAVLMFTKDTYKTQYVIANLAAKAAELFGVPVGSLKKSIYDLVIKNMFKWTDNYVIPYSVAKQMYHVNGVKKGEFLDILFAAYKSGDEKQYNRILQDMIKEGAKPDSIEEGLAKRFKDSGTEKTFSVPWIKPYKIEKKENDEFGLDDLSDTQYTAYHNKMPSVRDEIIEDLEQMRRGLSEEQYQIRLKMADDYAVQTTLEEIARGMYEVKDAWVSKAQTAEEELGLDPADFIMFYKHFKEMTPPKGQEKFKQNEKKNMAIDYLNSMDLTDAEWEYLFYEVGEYKK